MLGHITFNPKKQVGNGKGNHYLVQSNTNVEGATAMVTPRQGLKSVDNRPTAMVYPMYPVLWRR